MATAPLVRGAEAFLFCLQPSPIAPRCLLLPLLLAAVPVAVCSWCCWLMLVLLPAAGCCCLLLAAAVCCSLLLTAAPCCWCCAQGVRPVALHPVGAVATTFPPNALVVGEEGGKQAPCYMKIMKLVVIRMQDPLVLHRDTGGLREHVLQRVSRNSCSATSPYRGYSWDGRQAP